MRSRAALVAALLAASAVAAGCSEIPTSGPVIDAGAVEPLEEQRRFIEVSEAPPEPGMTPVEIVDGFIEAMASYEPGYETAREFLSEEAARQWDPSAGVTVFYEARPDTQLVGTDTVHVRMTVRGAVGSDGSFRELLDTPDRDRSSELQLVQEDGEWRIANPADGILIDDFSFDREYQARNVYFFDPRFEVLVPDVVYLPRTANDATATLLARRVLAGPTDWLAPAVVTAFPEGAELGIDSVPVRDGIATVDLSPEVALAGPEERERMAAQLIWTLGALPEVEAVRVLVSSGAPLAQSEPLTPRDPEMSGYDPAVLNPGTPLFAVGDTGVVSVTDGETAPVAGPLGDLPGISEIAVNQGGHRAVVITGDAASGTVVQAASFGEEEQLETLFQGIDLSSLAWDRTGLVWAVDHGVPGPGLIVTQPDGQPLEVLLDPELAGRDITRLAVSPDGARVALVVGGLAEVANVIRDVDAGTVRIGDARPVGPAGVAEDVAWSSSSPSWSAADAVVVLAHTQTAGAETSTTQPYLATLSGQEVVPRGLQVEDGERVAGSPGLPTVLQSADGVLYLQRSSNTWIELGPGRHPAYPG
ncbi:hypothetical protein E1212_18170 [Jiangella ureilytica]|uniref:GerMN domain-containing protein n=1 Tax=Jiangella ureilytica TaxID=2530374 RepID=A0A4R4RKI2_9ACTN|nr:LpqB family beta-propeller domain-containing protein [Jiangella ureilytica]TDC49499.1 hypothetical protein E1212_18170 [Jiangella ureilytica]